MTSDPESTLFDFAASNRVPTNEEEEIVTDLHAALGTTGVPIRLRRPPTLTPAPPWRRYMYAAMTFALVIAVASAGIFALRDQAGTPPPTEVPEVVLGLASPDSDESKADTATCEPGASIPIIQGVSTSPIDGVALLHTSDGDLILDCGGEQELLASDIENVTPWAWPGVVSLWDGESLTYLNIFTGDSYETEDHSHLNSLRPLGVITSRSTNRLIIVPDSGSPTSTAVLDLATMEAQPLRDHQGNSISLANIPAATSNYQGDCMVLAYSIHNTRLNSDYLGGFVVVDADGQTQTVDSLSLQMPPPREVATSPECDQIASVSYQGQQMEGTTTISIQNVTGEASISISLETPDMLTNLLWLKDGEGIIFGAGEDLMLWEAPFDSTEPATLHEGIVIDDISLTRDSDVVTAIGMSYGGGADSVPHRTLIIDTSTQDVTELEGSFIVRQRHLQPQEHNILLVQEAQGQVYDAATGEHLGQIDGDIEMSQSFIHLERENFGSTEPAIVGSGVDDMWRVLDSDGLPMFEKIELPADHDIQGHPMISVSRDGWMYISSGWDSPTGWMKDLDDPTAEWVEISFESDVNTVQFLNTQGLTASSSATAAASPTAAEACDFTGDVPIFAGLNSSPIGGSAVLVTLDRELKLVCDDEETLLAQGVTMANPTPKPHVLLAMTDEGPLLVNIVTEERLQIPLDLQPEQSQRIEANGWGDWLIFPSSDDNSMASLYHLETYTELPIETHDGRVTREAISEARPAQNATGDTFVLPISVVRETDSTYLAGFVVASGDGNVRFVETGQDPAPRQIAISPDGEMIAASSYQGAPAGGSTTISIYSAANGAVLDTWTHETRDTFFDLSWLDDGSALLYSDGSALYKVTEPGAEHEILFEGERLQGLTMTNDAHVVTIWHVTNTEPGQGEYETAIINAVTGEVSSLPGRDLWAGPTYTAKRTTLVLAEAVQATPGQSQTLTAVDAVTGDIIGDFEYTVPDGRGFSQSSWGNERGDIEVLAFSPNSMWLLVDADGNPTLEQIAPPPIDPDIGSEAVFLMNSPEGYLALRIYEPYSTWLTLPGQHEWIQVDIVEPQDDPGVLPSVSFVTGSD